MVNHIVQESAYQHVDRAGVKLAYREYGDPGGEPVLLVHGLFAAGWSWDGFAPRLAAAGRRVIVAELRGHGHSDKAGPYTFEVFADDLIFLLDSLEIGSLDLIGHSLGGHAASIIAQRQPQRIRRLVIEDARLRRTRAIVTGDRACARCRPDRGCCWSRS